MLAAALLAPLLVAAAAPAPPATLLIHDGPQGVTCNYYDEAAGVAWKHRHGDWLDAEGNPQGARPFAQASMPQAAPGRAVELDVTRLARMWQQGQAENAGMLIKDLEGNRGIARFASGQADEERSRPVLSVTYSNGRTEDLRPAGDSTILCSTVKSLATGKTLRVGRDNHIVIRFPLPRSGDRGEIRKAVLRLTTTGRQHGTATFGVFRVDPPLDGANAQPRMGLAAAYRGDAGIDRDPDVLLAERFESSSWMRNWSYVRKSETYDLVAEDAPRRFEALQGQALRVKVEKDKHLGLNAGYRFHGKTGSEPEEIYFRYYLRFGDDWRQTRDGGKMPGIAGTYNRAGWGGRKPDGTNGWSMRGGFSKAIPDGHPFAGGTTLGTYAYHAEVESKYGVFWPWSMGLPGVLLNNRWYCIEQYFRLNTPGKNDGILRVWIDGRLAMERTRIRVRDIDELRIEQVWLNIYHGGTAVSPRDQHAYLDNIVIARRYIGPMSNGAR